jgi:hypothetical protein
MTKSRGPWTRRTASGGTVRAAVVAVLVLAGCASAPSSPSGATAAPAPTASSTRGPDGGAQSRPSARSPTPSIVAPAASWTRLPTSDALRGATLSRLVSGPTGLLAVGSSERSGFVAWTSADGGEWVGSMVVANGVATAAVARSDGFVVLGKIGDGSELEQAIAWQSPDGGVWTGARIDGLKTSPIGVASITGRITTFAIRAPSGGEPTLAWSSGNLRSWTSDRLGGGGYSNAAGLAALSDGSGLAFGRWSVEPMDTAPFPPGEAAFWRSTDGRAWQKTVDDQDFASALITDIAQREGAAIVAVGQRWNPAGPPDQAYAMAFWASSDGESWDRTEGPASLDPALVPERVVITPAGYLLVASAPTGGSNALVAASADGRTWAAIDPAIAFDGGRANDVAFHGNRLVAVGQLLPANGASGGDAGVWIGPWNNLATN